MKNFTGIILIAVVVVLMGVIGYIGWYEWDRAQKVTHNEACDIKMAMHTVSESADDTIPNSPCVYELAPAIFRD